MSCVKLILLESHKNIYKSSIWIGRKNNYFLKEVNLLAKISKLTLEMKWVINRKKYDNGKVSTERLKDIYENNINNNVHISKLESLDNINYMSSIFFKLVIDVRCFDDA